jgi:hypothetical protein
MAKQKIYIPTYISSIDFKPARVLPRVFFYNGLLDTDTFYIQDNDGVAAAQPAFPYFDNYLGNLPTSGSRSLLFNNEQSVYGETPTESLYSEYWSSYVNLLYNPRTRLINCTAIIPLANYFKLNLNDVVEWRGNYYHLRAINNYNLSNGECTLQLLGPIIGDVLAYILPGEPCRFEFEVSDTGSLTTTTTTIANFFGTVCYGDTENDACNNPTFCFTMTGNALTFCDSTVFTSLGWNIIATGNYVISFGGNSLTVSHTFGQDYATVYGGGCVSCPPPPSTTTSTTSTTTLPPADNYYFARAYVCDGTCNYNFDTFVKMAGPGIIGKFYREPGPISLWSYELVATVPITTGTYLTNLAFNSCALACVN